MRVRGLGELKFVVDYWASQDWKQFEAAVVAFYDWKDKTTQLNLRLVPKEGLNPQQLDQILSKAENFDVSPIRLKWSKKDTRDRLLTFWLEDRIRDLEGCLKAGAKLLEKAAKLLEKKQSKETAYSE